MSVSRICLLVTIALWAAVAAAQEAERPQDAWLERAESFTNDSIKDIRSLEPLDGALVLGQLGAQWWNTDPDKAHKWLLKAVETVELEPSRENPAERRKRLSVARSLLAIISATDQKLWERLRGVLTPDETHPSDAERTASAEALISAALVVVKTDPQRAAAMGAAALRIGLPTTIQHLLWELRGGDSMLADQLFIQALAVAGKTSDEDFLNSLRYAAFPELLGTGFDPAVAPSDALRGQMLRILADYLQQRTALLASKGIRDCGLAPALVERLQVHFDRLQPLGADLVRQIVRICQESTSHSVTEPDVDPESSGVSETVDTLLAQADKTADKKTKRPAYLARAARLAAQQKKLELAIKILDSMSDDERQFVGIWETWRRDWAVAWAIEFMRRNDVNGAQQVIKSVPDALRPFARISFVDKLPKESTIEIAPDLLGQSRKDLANSEKADLEKVYWYLMIVRLYSRSQLESEALATFKDAVASLNRTQVENTTETANRSENIDTKIIPANFPVTLLESQGYAIREAVASITSVRRRARVRLDLVQISIKEYRALATMQEKKTSSRTPK